jgi:TP901-1 family phage major tail protein
MNKVCFARKIHWMPFFNGMTIEPIYSKENHMSAQKAKDLLIKIQDAGAFTTIAGLRTKHLRMNTETVDITHSESAGRWRELLAGAGVKRMSVSGSGVFKDEASDALLRTLFFNGTIVMYQLIVPDFGTFEGLFQVTSLELQGQHSGELNFDLALESAGALAFTAI